MSIEDPRFLHCKSVIVENKVVKKKILTGKLRVMGS